MRLTSLAKLALTTSLLWIPGCSEYEKELDLETLLPVLLLKPSEPASPINCDALTPSGGEGVTETTHGLGRSSGSFLFSWNAYGIPDRFQIFYQGALIFDSGVISGAGSATVVYAGAATSVLVRVTGSTSGTFWEYTLGCPN